MQLPLITHIIFLAWSGPVLASNTSYSIAVGFDLKDSYGTAAITYPNGTAKVVARVDGNDQYRETLKRLSLWSSVHDAPPYTTPGQRWNDWPRQQKRKARKAVGLPASGDVGNISTLIQALKEATEEFLGFSIQSASASVPRFPAIYDEDLYDSFEYIGLDYIQLLSSPTYEGRLLLFEPFAAITGHGMALCPDIEHPQKCWEDGGFEDHYYVVDYTKSSLYASHLRTFANGPYDGLDSPEYSLELGSDARHKSPDESYYWEEVRKVLLIPLIRYQGRVPSKIILVGESSMDEGFRKTLHDTMESFFKRDIPPIIDTDPIFAPSKGVAELVRRSVYLPKPERPEGIDQALQRPAPYLGEGSQKPV